jgi:hypothetical protein
MALEITERGREFVKTVEFAAGLLDVIVTGLKEKFDDERLEAFAMEFIMLTLTERLADPDHPPTREEIHAFFKEHGKLMDDVLRTAIDGARSMARSIKIIRSTAPNAGRKWVN